MSVPAQKEELELINRARKGSVEAFEQLVLQYQDSLYRFLLVRANNRADAEDILQETFVAVFKYLSGYQSKYRFSTWLFTIAIRQLGRQRKRPADPENLLDTVACESAGPEQQGIETEQRSSIWQTSRKCLNEAQFTALWLFYVEDMSLIEVGKIMKRPASWVKVNLMRARRRLSKELQKNHFEPVVSAREVTL